MPARVRRAVDSPATTKTRDTLIEAVVEAQINGQFAPGGTTRADVARAAQALPLTPGMTATAGDLLLDADTQLQLRGLDAARLAQL